MSQHGGAHIVEEFLDALIVLRGESLPLTGNLNEIKYFSIIFNFEIAVASFDPTTKPYIEPVQPQSHKFLVNTLN